MSILRLSGNKYRKHSFMMNIKLAKNTIRIRINRDELTSLLSGESLSLTMAITPDKPFCIDVSAVETQNKNIELITTPSRFVFTVLISALLDLEKKLPTKTGIQDNWTDYAENVLILALEVDVKNR